MRLGWIAFDTTVAVEKKQTLSAGGQTITIGFIVTYQNGMCTFDQR